MNLFLIENDNSINQICESNLYNHSEDIIICFNYLVFIKLQRDIRFSNYYLTEDFLDESDYKGLHEFTDQIAFNWYKSKKEDLSLYNGISFGDIVKIVFSRTYLMSILVKYGEVIRKALLKWNKIENVYFDFSNSNNVFLVYKDDGGRFFNKNRLVTLVTESFGLKSTAIEPRIKIPTPFEVSLGSTQRNVPTTREKIIKKIENSINIINKIIHFNSKNNFKTYFFSYFNLTNFIDSISGGFVINGLANKKYIFKYLFHGISFLRFEEIDCSRSSKDKKFLSDLEEIFLKSEFRQNFDAEYKYQGIDYFSIYHRAIENIISNIIPKLLRYSKQVEVGIRRFNLKQIILNEEIAEEQQVILEVCRRDGLKTIWIDHGIQGFNHAQKVCDRNKSSLILCTGSFFIDYYKSQSLKEREYLALGNPSMDQYPIKMRKKISKINNVLFLSFEDSIYARLDRFIYQEKYYEEMFSIFPRLIDLDIEIFYKPHPNESEEYHDYLFNFFNINKDDLIFLKNIPFSKIIYDMDLVVSNVSSCFYESQVAGVPTIFMEPVFIKDALLPPLNSENGKEVLRVGTGKELLRIIESNRENPEFLNGFLDVFLKEHAHKYMGKLDGNASKRIIEYLANNF